MTEITFQRPTPALMSMNDRHHWRKKAGITKVWRYAACVHGIQNGVARLNLGPSVVRCTFEMAGAHRRDPHNYYPTVKAIIDGLVDAGAWPDDTPEFVSTVEPSIDVVKHRPLMVTVTITPKEGAG